MNKFILPTILSLILILHSFSGLAQSWDPLGPDDYNQLAGADGLFPNHAIDNNGVVYVVLQSTNGLLVKKLNGATWEVVGTGVIDDKFTVSMSIVFEKSTNTPYIAYSKSSSPWHGVVKRFNGTTWENVGSSGFTNGEAGRISLVFNGSTPYVVYKDISAAGEGVSMMKYNGTDWEHVGQPRFSPGRADFITMAFYGNTPYVAFEDIKDYYDADDITIMKFNGTAWEKVGSSITAANSSRPSIAISDDGVPYVSFLHANDTNKRSKLYRFTAGTWQTVGTQGNGTDQRVWSTKIKFDNNILYAVFLDANLKVAVNKMVSDTWFSVGNGQFSGEPYAPFDQEKVVNIDFYNHLPYVSYRDFSNNAVVKKFNGIHWQPVGSQELSVSASPMKVGVNGGIPYIVMTDRGNNNSIVVRKFNGNNWEAISGFIGQNLNAFDIAFNSDGNAAIAFGENSGIHKRSMASMFNGTNWLDLGEFSPQKQVSYAKLAFNTENPNIPYVMFKDIYSGVLVKKYVGGVWAELADIGNPGAALGFPSFALQNNTPYVAYGDPTNGNKLTISKYNGTAWEPVGSPGFSTHPVGPNQIAFNTQGVPHIAFANSGQGINLMKFDGTNWVALAAPISTNGYAIVGLSMVIHNNIPFISYADNLNGKKAVVKRLNGTSWEDVGSNPTFGEVNYPSLTADGNTLYLSYANTAGTFVKKFDLNTLPVELMSFTAKVQNQKVQLQWQTASENNNNVFIVMHMADGNSFKEIARIQGKEKANSLTSYGFEHYNPTNGTNYYQLLQVDLDGKTSDLGTKTVNFKFGNQLAVVYPNPTTDQLNIAVGNTSLKKVELVDLNGRTLQTITVKPNQSLVTILLKNYPSGIYMLKTFGNDGTATHKIIKQ